MGADNCDGSLAGVGCDDEGEGGGVVFMEEKW